MTYLLQSVDAEPTLVELHRNGYETVAALRTSFLRQRATELNLLHETDTMETPHLRLFRKQDIELVIHEMASEGHHVEPLNMWPGGGPLDAYVRSSAVQRAASEAPARQFRLHVNRDNNYQGSLKVERPVHSLGPPIGSIAASQAGARMHHTCSQARIGRHTRQRRGHGRAGCAAD